MITKVLPHVLVYCFFFTSVEGVNILECDSGSVDVVVGTSDFALVCDTAAVTWEYKDPSNPRFTIGTCDSSTCTLDPGLPGGFFSLSVQSGTSSRLDFTSSATAMSFGGYTYFCQGQPCIVNIVEPTTTTTTTTTTTPLPTTTEASTSTAVTAPNSSISSVVTQPGPGTTATSAGTNTSVTTPKPDSNTSTTEKPNKQKTIAIIVGSVVGGVALLIVVTATVFCCCKRKKKKAFSASGTDNSTGQSQHMDKLDTANNGC